VVPRYLESLYTSGVVIPTKENINSPRETAPTSNAPTTNPTWIDQGSNTVSSITGRRITAWAVICVFIVLQTDITLLTGRSKLTFRIKSTSVLKMDTFCPSEMLAHTYQTTWWNTLKDNIKNTILSWYRFMKQEFIPSVRYACTNHHIAIYWHLLWLTATCVSVFLLIWRRQQLTRPALYV